jgi:hypothetical protein
MNSINKWKCALFLAAGLGLLTEGCHRQSTSGKTWSLDKSVASAQLKMFVAEKEAQANAATNAAAPGFAPFFAAAKRGDWLAVSNTFVDFRKHAGQYEHTGKTDVRLRGTAWAAVMETYGAMEQFALGDEKYTAAFGNDIIESIPPGSIYFGGTDQGRFLITAMQKSHVNADPFFTLTQNALADGTYLDYLRSMYGEKIYIPTKEDSQKSFQDYVADAKQRLQNHQLKPGEGVKVTSGSVQVSGQVAVMSINSLLAKVIFDKNPNHEFYIEESFPLNWMYPYLEPHGLIMKINRQPPLKLSDEIIQRDRDYWTKYVTPMIGDWLNNNTSVREVAAFAKKVYVKKDFNGFTGDPQFVQNDYSCKMFSKLRTSIGGLYVWRAQHAADASEKERMNDEAGFAFRQAFALCPYLPEVVFRYAALLTSENRGADALLVAETAAQMPSMQGRDGEQIRSLVKQLQRLQKAN